MNRRQRFGRWLNGPVPTLSDLEKRVAGRHNGETFGSVVYRTELLFHGRNICA